MKTTVMPHPSYSPDLTPLKLQNISRAGTSLAGFQFQSASEVKSASQAELKDMGKNGFQKCFDELHKRWQKCSIAQESYLEGGCVLAT
ncbi:hypothetical protein TNCV_3376221 [Trichonephila clavipes]|nr:hypothetical protein TNCV_3376221 [Trichonephila clavipes]